MCCLFQSLLIGLLIYYLWPYDKLVNCQVFFLKWTCVHQLIKQLLVEPMRKGKEVPPRSLLSVCLLSSSILAQAAASFTLSPLCDGHSKPANNITTFFKFHIKLKSDWRASCSLLVSEVFPRLLYLARRDGPEIMTSRQNLIRLHSRRNTHTYVHTYTDKFRDCSNNDGCSSRGVTVGATSAGEVLDGRRQHRTNRVWVMELLKFAIFSCCFCCRCKGSTCVCGSAKPNVVNWTG